MESSPSALLKLLLPKTPFLLKTALWHGLSLSETSSKWDLRTAITVNLLREMTGPNSAPSSITAIQNLTTKDPGVKGNVWVSKVKLEAVEEDDARQLVFKAIEDMGTGEEQWTKPDTRPLEGEWNGYRAGVKANEPEPADMSEEEKYNALMKETTSKTTVLYMHGGALYLLDPATYRPTTSRLAQETGGRVFSVRYRLSPQNPFPAALLDCFTAYLSLLHPPASAPHAAVPASEIVLAGDSAGGTCCTALLQLLLHLHRTSSHPTVKFHGRQVPIPLPAGVAMTSPWLDITRSLPSIESATLYDYLPPPSSTQKQDFPPDSAWPATPPRADLYCDSSALLHPLVSPLCAKHWYKSPPLFFSLGQEMLRDEIALFAQRAVSQGVSVVWREFKAMPHCFAIVLPHLPAAHLHEADMAAFCTSVVRGAHVESNAVLLEAKSLQSSSVDVRCGLSGIDEVEIEGYMRKGKERIERKFRSGRGEGDGLL